MKFFQFFEKQKLLIKSDHKIIYKKPWIVFILPFIFLNIFYNRLNQQKTSVFLLEMNIHEIDCKNNLPYSIINDFSTLQPVLKERLREDSTIDEFYFLQIRSRFDRGDYVYLGYYQNEPATFLFITKKYAYLNPVRVKVKLPINTIGIYDVYTFRKYRGLGLYKILFQIAVYKEKKEGFNTIWLWLVQQNETSVIVHHKLGFKKVIAEYTQLQRLGFKWVTKKTLNMDSSNLLNK